jgi:hypothetical protein
VTAQRAGDGARLVRQISRGCLDAAFNRSVAFRHLSSSSNPLSEWMTLPRPAPPIHFQIDLQGKAVRHWSVPEPLRRTGRLMAITRVLRSDCPSGIDCDRIYDTDGSDLVVQGRLVSDPAELAALGVSAPPAGEAIVLIGRHLLPEVANAPAGGR